MHGVGIRTTRLLPFHLNEKYAHDCVNSSNEHMGIDTDGEGARQRCWLLRSASAKRPVEPSNLLMGVPEGLRGEIG